jgi:Ca2+-binding RTX toxin-like protein
MANFFGNDSNNSLFGTNGTDYIFGFGGDDTLQGYAGNDWIEGGEGNDKLYGGYGADTLLGGTGNDAYFLIYDYDTVTEKAGEGRDGVYAWFDYQLPDNVEDLYLTGTAMHGFGNGQDNYIYGNSSVNVIWGFGGDDHLWTGDGNDTLYGGVGNDYLNGEAGADKMLGGTGNDSYIIDNAGDVVTENANEGTDAVYAKVSYALAANVEYLFLVEEAGAINGYGNALDNWINGTSGNNLLMGGDGSDVLHGFDGADTLYGGIGADVLRGDPGDDTLYGDSGNDNLYGNTGVDVMTGGTGADIFEFRTLEDSGYLGATADHILDFAENDGDKIDLSLIDASSQVAGNQAFTWIGNNNAFYGEAGQLRYNNGWVEGDTNGDMQADFRIQVDSADLHDYAFVL